MNNTILLGNDFVRAIRHPECLRVIEQVLDGERRAVSTIFLERPVPTTYHVTGVLLGEENAYGARAMLSFNDVSHVR